MTIRSFVQMVPGAQEAPKEEFAPCGHTKAQAEWLGCGERSEYAQKKWVCRARDEQVSERYQKWVKAGRPEGGF